MFKTLLIVSVVIFSITSCATYTPPPKTKRVFYYQHPIHGEVTEESEAYINAGKNCEAKVYVLPIVIDDVPVSDRDSLQAIAKEHFGAYTRARLNQDFRINGAYAGTQGALAVSTGNTSNLSSPKSKANPINYIFDYEKSELPEHIVKIKGLNKDYLECIKTSEGFVLSRVDSILEETGEVVSSTDLTKIVPAEK